VKTDQISVCIKRLGLKTNKIIDQDSLPWSGRSGIYDADDKGSTGVL
jgi:hypothetical protein